ncbi:MAG: N-6 DNA methylase [Anaeromyxobacteraceae bacterium]
MASRQPATANIDARIKRIFDHLYANGPVRTPSAIAGEVGKLIRTATFIERATGAPAAFAFPEALRRQLAARGRDAVRSVASDVRARFAEMNAAWGLYAAEGLLLSDEDVAWCCGELQGERLSSEGRDVFGDAVEIFRTSWAKQSSGQFFTDGNVTHLAMTLLEFDPLAGDDLVDICCGTGGFLLAGLDAIRRAVAARGDERDEAVAVLAARALAGQEIDPELADMARASLVGRIGAAGRGLVERGDSLRPEAFRGGASRLREGSHACAASNPPFGSKITVKDPSLLEAYDLARRGRGARPAPCSPDVLLLERNIRMLAPGVGRAAIVLPYQILSGPQTRSIREWLLRQVVLQAVVDLPAETFQPHTGTKTALLVVRRREAPVRDARDLGAAPVFMSAPRWIGHDRRGKPVHARDARGRATEELRCDMGDVARAFLAFRRGEEPAAVHAESFVVSTRDVAADPGLRLNARYHRGGARPAADRPRARRGRTVRLGDVVERVFFPGRFKRRYVERSPGAVPFFGGANISQLIPPIDKWLAPDDPRLPDLVVREGWLLVTRSGTTGVVSSVPKAWDGVAISEHVIRIVPRPPALDPAWIQAFLRSGAGQAALARGVFGSVIDEITPEHVANLEVPLLEDAAAQARIARAVTQGERARQTAIERIAGAVAAIDEL